MMAGRTVAVVLFLFINCLFIYKYGGRVLSHPEWICLIYILLNVAILKFGRSWPRIRSNWVVMGAVAWILLVTVGVHITVPLSSLNVDRWSVIASFWDALAAGDYPYFARSHMGNPPGPMPIYFVLAAPFYAIGWQELLAALGYVSAVAWMGRSPQGGTLPIWLLLASPFMYWEIAVRSNIFSYSMLVLAALQCFLVKQTPSRAIMVGLALSTRSVFALAYVVYYLRIWRQPTVETPKFFRLSVISAGAFFFSFLPLLMIWPQEFQIMNPFVVQGSFLVPPLVIGVFFLGAVMASYRFLEMHAALLSGLLLFGVILVYGIYHVVDLGWGAAYLESKVDISYFLFCVPFLGYYFIASTNDRASAVRSVPRTTAASGNSAA